MFLRSPNLLKLSVDLGEDGVKRLTRAAVAKRLELQIEAPHGWVFCDDDGWEHNPNPQHPQARGEAEYGENFRPATAEEAASPDYFRAPAIHMSFASSQS